MRAKTEEWLIRYLFDLHRERQKGIWLFKKPLEKQERSLIPGHPIRNPLMVAGEVRPHHLRACSLEYLSNLLLQVYFIVESTPWGRVKREALLMTALLSKPISTGIEERWADGLHSHSPVHLQL